jgi:outer membrane immunogenic protein
MPRAATPARERPEFFTIATSNRGPLSLRIGYAWDRFLGYVNAGGAWEDVDYSASTIIVGTAYTSSDTRSGWTIGAGGEYAFTRSISGFVEYDYYDFGTADIHLTPQIAGLPQGFLDIDESASIVRAGLNLRFGE